jgi:SAM-dependent methyltransferase
MRRNHHHRRRLDDLLRALKNLRPGSSVIEVGCGTGLLASDLARFRSDLRFEGVDVDQSLVDFARNSYRGANLTFTTADIDTVAAAGARDLAYSVDVLHHVNPIRPFAQAVRACLRPGASWIVYEPNRFNPVIAYQQESMKRRGLGEDHFYEGSVTALLTNTGFNRATRVYCFAFPAAFEPPNALERLGLVVERSRLVGSSVRIDYVAC